MSGRSTDINQCILMAGDGQATHRQVSNSASVSSFAISCTQSLWDVVGSFLGRRVKSQCPCSVRLCEEVAVVLI